MRSGILAASVALLVCGTGIPGHANAAPRIEIVHSFAPGEARFPGTEATLVQGPGNLLYGVSQAGGHADKGTLYSFNTRTGEFRQLHSFSRPDGGDIFPTGVATGPAGEILVTTHQGGDHMLGAIYSVDSDGEAVVIHSFDGLPIGHPSGPLIPQDGFFYGTSEAYNGTAYRFDIQGNVEPIHAFPPSLVSPDEQQPFGFGAGGAGTFHGATWGWYAPPETHGAIFSLRTSGEYAVLHHFNGADGSRPHYPPVRARDGNLYGTAMEGGPTPDSCGVVYRLAPNGTFTVVHAFEELVDGCNPESGLIVARSGKIYGVNGAGVFYEVKPGNRIKVLARTVYGGPESIQSPMIETAPKVFYGVSSAGGQHGRGTIYRFRL